MKKWILTILAVVIAIGIGLFAGFKHITNNPSALLDSKIADKTMSVIINNIDAESIDIEAIKETKIDRKVVNDTLEEYGLSGIINIENMTDQELEAWKDKLVKYLEENKIN